MAVVTGSFAAVSELIPLTSSTPGESTDTLLTLEVTRGHTLFPNRPVTGSRFLIGAGVGCHLRLGGPDLPTLHSLIVIDGRDVVIESIAIEPPLMVNGRRVTSAVLSHGDRIEIGPFHMTARMIPPAATVPESADQNQSVIAAADHSPAELSAMELIERLEHELQVVDEFDARRELGATALIDAARTSESAGDLPVPPDSVPVKSEQIWRIDHSIVPAPHFRTGRVPDRHSKSDEVLVDDLQRLHDDLQRFSGLLEARAERLSHQEASVAEAAAELVEAQQRLSQQLELLLSQTQAEADSQSIAATSVRASA